MKKIKFRRQKKPIQALYCIIFLIVMFSIPLINAFYTVYDDTPKEWRWNSTGGSWSGVNPEPESRDGDWDTWGGLTTAHNYNIFRNFTVVNPIPNKNYRGTVYTKIGTVAQSNYSLFLWDYNNLEWDKVASHNLSIFTGNVSYNMSSAYINNSGGNLTLMLYYDVKARTGTFPIVIYEQAILFINNYDMWDILNVYDNIDDSILDTDLWSTSTDSTGGISTVTENNEYIRAQSSHVTGINNGQASFQTNPDFININNVQNLTLQANLSALLNGGSGNSLARLYVFGSLVGDVSCIDNSPCNRADFSNWSIVRNTTEPFNSFDVYDDGVFNKTIQGTHSFISINSSRATSGSPTSAISNSYLYFLNYTLGNSSMNTTLNSPNDNLRTGESEINFNISSTVTLNNLSNVSLFINDILNDTVNWNGTDNETVFNKNLMLNESNWSIRVCDTSNNCKIETTRFFNFTLVGFLNETFNNETTEGGQETFTFTVNTPFDNQQLVSGFLIYNNTEYSGNVVNVGGDNYTISTIISIPTVTTDTNFTFFWNLILRDNTEINTSVNNQTVLNINIDNCTTHSELILNLTLRDEEDLSLVLGNQNITVEVDLNIFPLGSNDEIINFSQTYNTTYSTVCLSALNNSYRMDSTIKYFFEDSVAEYYHIQNFTLSNSTIPQNITLYSLISSKAQEFLINLRDEDFLPLDNALIDISRYYVGEGLFRTVEIPRTDSEGQTLGHFNIDDNIIYNIIISKDGVLLGTFENVLPVCADESIGDCSINLNLLTGGSSVDRFESRRGLNYNMSFNADTKVVSVIFSTTDGSIRTVTLNVSKFDRFSNQTVCTDSLLSSSGTMSCTVPNSFGNITIQSELYSNGELIETEIYRIAPKPSELYGLSSVFFMMIMVLILPLMFITSTIGIIIGVFIAMIMGFLLGFTSNSVILGAGSSLIWLFIAGGIIIWRLVQRSK